MARARVIFHSYKTRLPLLSFDFFFPFLLHPSARALSISVKQSAESGFLLVENYTLTAPTWVRLGREFLEPFLLESFLSLLSFLDGMV